MNITSASVRVLRSHDYCHFEVALTAERATQVRMGSFPDSTEIRLGPITLEDIDGLRKEAARLADKAVEQYKKKKAALEVGLSYEYKNLEAEAAKITAMAEGDRSVEHKAILKRVGDMRHAVGYDYQDRWDDPEDGE